MKKLSDLLSYDWRGVPARCGVLARAKATEYVVVARVQGANFREWSGTVNWPVTLTLWVMHLVSRTFVTAAIGFFVVDLVLYSFVGQFGWGFSEGQVLSSAEVEMGFNYLLKAKIIVTIAAFLASFLVGWRSPVTVYKYPSSSSITG